MYFTKKCVTPSRRLSVSNFRGADFLEAFLLGILDFSFFLSFFFAPNALQSHFKSEQPMNKFEVGGGGVIWTLGRFESPRAAFETSRIEPLSTDC